MVWCGVVSCFSFSAASVSTDFRLQCTYICCVVLCCVMCCVVAYSWCELSANQRRREEMRGKDGWCAVVCCGVVVVVVSCRVVSCGVVWCGVSCKKRQEYETRQCT